MSTKQVTRGYTLIELIVSVAIFSLVMLFVTTAFLALIAATRHARATSALMTNMDSAVEYMARSIRTGTSYKCDGIAADCPAGTSLTFVDDQGKTVTFLVANGALAVCANGGACNSSTASPLTDPSITISSLTFLVRGVGTYSTGDRVQPSVVMAVKGSSAVPRETPITFSIQTMGTDRIIDIGT